MPTTPVQTSFSHHDMTVSDVHPHDSGVNTGQLPAPGVLAQSFVQSVASRFVLVIPREQHDSPLSPRSEQMVNASPCVTSALTELLGENEGVIKAWPLKQGKKRSYIERDELLEQVRKDWADSPNVARAHKSLAMHEALHRVYSDQMLASAQRPRLERSSHLVLDQLERLEDLTGLQQAVLEMSGETASTAQALWRYLTGRSPEGEKLKKNFLITIVRVNGDPKFKLLSVSGDFSPPCEQSQAEGALDAVLDVVGNGRQESKLRARALHPSAHHDCCSVQTNLSRFTNQAEPDWQYVGYPDLIIGSHTEIRHEPRLLPRTLTPGAGGLHDRARDTEYSALTALMIILESNSEIRDQPLDITMYSRLPMCHACQNAASFAILNPVFAGLRSFKVYGAA